MDAAAGGSSEGLTGESGGPARRGVAAGSEAKPLRLEKVLAYAARVKASDVHLKAGLGPSIRVDGGLYAVPKVAPCTPEQLEALALGMMTERHRQAFQARGEVNLAYILPEQGRFRVSVYRERGSVAMAIRLISLAIPSLDELGLPPVIRRIALEERGLVLVTGSTGCGKSSTLAAMVDLINTERNRNIITIEDPIEFHHTDRRSLISQREVGEDTPDFGTALLGALRQDPDVILVGEMRDRDTIGTAMLAAETGHLVLATLHTLDAPETINRIISAFPHEQQRQVRLQLSSILRAVVSQRLVPRAEGRGRVPAVEVMLATARVKECIADIEKSRYLAESVAQGDQYGMQSFDQSLVDLFSRGLISYEEALRQSTNPDALALRASGVSPTGVASTQEAARNRVLASEQPAPAAREADKRGIELALGDPARASRTRASY